MDKTSPVVEMITNYFVGCGLEFSIDEKYCQGCMDTLLSISICSGMEFNVDDFEEIDKLFFNNTSFDRFYCLACKCDNLSACIAFEKFRAFEPIFHNGKRLCDGGEMIWSKQKLTIRKITASNVLASSGTEKITIPISLVVEFNKKNKNTITAIEETKDKIKEMCSGREQVEDEDILIAEPVTGDNPLIG